MPRVPLPLLAGLAPILLLTGAMPVPGPGTLTVVVGNIRSANGKVHVDVCSRAHFVTDGCEYAGEVPARYGTTTVTVHGLPPGQFAVQATHDENGNGKTDRNFLGIPTEGFGFSRDAKVRLGPPRWEDAVIPLDGTAQTIHLKMRYMIGARGPDDKN